MIFNGCCPTSYHKLGGSEQQKFIILKFLGLKVQNQGVSSVMVFPETPLEEFFFASSSSWWLPAHLGLWAAELICVRSMPAFTVCVCVSESPSYGGAAVIGCRANPNSA